ncbi:MAG: TonB-dependent receptor [Phaeospirillum sp.]|nr:TonB-dependent receptor [Phaeospirillum sp.]
MSVHTPRALLRASVSRAVLMVAASLLALPAMAEEAETDLPDIVVKETPTVAEKYKLPNTTESITAAKLADTINVINTQDAVKYMPSIFIRKRNNGDTQSTMSTRTWGSGSSARSMVYADDVLISALLANDNSNGGPRWGMVSAEEIERVDMAYGPFAAQHAGNAMGGVLQITTRMPDKLEATVKQTESLQSVSLYNTKDTYRTDQTNVTIGNRIGDLRFFLSAETANSASQPLTVVTNNAALAGITGQISALNKSGAAANVVGVGGLLRTEMETMKAKVAYDLTPELRAAYTFGFWQNHGRATVETYLRDAAGNPTYGTASTTSGIATGFAGGNYILEQMHSMHALSLKSDTKGMWDFELVGTHLQYDRDFKSQPLGTAGGAAFTNAGKFTSMEGTNWSTADAKGIWRPTGKGGDHEVSFGTHFDRYVLVNTTYYTPNWRTESFTTGKNSDSRGNTQTTAAWAQDSWKFAPGFKATLGGRYEYWNTFDGFNATTAGTSTIHPSKDATAFSPKGSLAWEFVPQWTATASVGRAIRFPTVAELYQMVTSGGVQTVPNATLAPERVTSYELSLEGQIDDGRLRASLFLEQVKKAMISQASFLNGVSTTYVNNVDEIRNRGVELAAQKNHVLIRDLEFSGSLTYLDAEIVRNPTWTGGTQVEGKRVPNVPDWKATLVATYRPVEQVALSAAGRYQGKISSTLDNTDYVHGVYGAFDPFFVVDIRANYRHNENLEAAIGIDNVNDAGYWQFHPFPQRTFIAEVKLKL